MIKLGVSGALGKMGGRILALAAKDEDFQVVLALERISHPEIGTKVSGLDVVSSLDAIRQVDGLIEFTSPEATLEHLSYAAKYKKAMVIGTTGFTEGQVAKIVLSAKSIPIVFSPNMSIGVNLFFELVREAASRLPQEYKVRMSEAHHVHKKDAPSGTARLLLDLLRRERRQQEIDIKSLREGEIIGDHDVIFEGPLDTLKFSHSAKSRDIFAHGALEALKFIVKKKSGLYAMADVLKRSR
jgi:4-hydroxy-tetrahydrodipicolinate reductase